MAEILHAGTIYAKDELINFWARSGSQSGSWIRISPGFRTFLREIGRSSNTAGRIWLTFWMRAPFRPRTNWLPFEPDPDHTPDPGSGFPPDFGFCARCLKILSRISTKLGMLVTPVCQKIRLEFSLSWGKCTAGTHQKLSSSSLAYKVPAGKNAAKSVHSFVNYIRWSQTDTQTDKHLNHNY